jgi:molybdopterin-dependent oxidoreductase alpha subunit
MPKLLSFNPRHWASWRPFGLGQTKPHHYTEMLRIAWQNRDNLPYAWRILTQGVCDGCALGTAGLRDFTMPDVHLCVVRLNLLRLNTMGALDVSLLADAAALAGTRSTELRALGRLPYPMLRRKGEPGFRRISWDAALDLAAGRIRASDPRRIAFYLTSRGITNEVYYVAQKVARFLGTNNVDNAARICHSPSTVALSDTIGVGASTVSYSDWIGSDLVVLIGSNIANNQPVATKYLYEAKQAGTEIAVINPYQEPGLSRYWVPSVPESALFGTRLMDHFFQVAHGGDIGFLNGTLKHLIAQGWVDHGFIAAHTAGWPALRESLAAQSWEQLEAASGTSRDEMLRFARLLAAKPRTVLIWSMGITQHACGVENVQAIVNLALARGSIGKAKSGLVPIRGHSGVQGGGEMGATPSSFPGHGPVSAASAAQMQALWGFPVPDWQGLDATSMIEAAHEGRLDVLYSSGGNFLEVLPEPDYVQEALARTPLRIHQDIVLSSQMFVEPAGAVLLLPAQTRYEQRGGCTETSTERRVYFSPEIRGPRIGEARSEWEIFMALAARVRPADAQLIHFPDAHAVRVEIARVIPQYRGIERLRKAGDAFQWGGPRLCEGGAFPTPDGKGRFTPLDLPAEALPPGQFKLSTRRGKQFNSIVQGQQDALTGARREIVLMAAADLAALGLRDGDRVRLASAVGVLEGTVQAAPIMSRHIQVFWPEGNVLVPRGRRAASGVPDYNAYVTVEKITP